MIKRHSRMAGDRGRKGLVTFRGQRGGKCTQSTVGGEGMEADEIRHRRRSDGPGPRWGREGGELLPTP